jgi:hypothetical protein
VVQQPQGPLFAQLTPSSCVCVAAGAAAVHCAVGLWWQQRGVVQQLQGPLFAQLAQRLPPVYAAWLLLPLLLLLLLLLLCIVPFRLRRPQHLRLTWQLAQQLQGPLLLG